jgi:hypothetical protein
VDDDDDDELEEESLLETPLDKVEPYSMFKHALLRLQQEQPALYENLTKNLNPDEQQVVQSAVHQADVIAAAQVRTFTTYTIVLCTQNTMQVLEVEDSITV